MSDSEDDFASADEGEIGATASGVINEKAKESQTDLDGSEVAGKPDKKASTSPENTSDLGLKDTKVSKKTEKVVCGKSDKQDKDVVQKHPSGGKGKRKGKKGKKGDNYPSGKTLDKKTDNSLERDAVKQTDDKKLESTHTEATENNSLSKHVEMVDKKESESGNSNDFVKEVEAQSDDKKVTASLSDKVSDVTITSSEEMKPDSMSDTPSKQSITEKADLIKSPSSQNISRSDPDHCEKEEAVSELAGSEKQTKSGWGWGWGSSLLEVASSSVSTFTHQVGEGLHTMMETVETTLNVPNPEELAQNVDKEKDMNVQETSKSEKDEESSQTDNVNKEDNNKVENQTNTSNTNVTPTQSTEAGKTVDNQSGDGWFSAWGVSNISKMVENTGKSLVTGSLDVLETLGKKTFDVINEQDPGLKNARSLLNDSRNKPNLSALLRDAKEQHEAEAEYRRESEEAHKAHFGSLFDEFHGLAHLEALEMLSNQSEKRVNVHLNAMSSECLAELKPTLLQIKHMFDVDDLEEDDTTKHDFTAMVKDLFQKLNVRITPEKLLQVCDRIGENITQCNDTETTKAIKEIHRLAISSLAEFTSKCIEQFHKMGELILIQKSDDINFVECSKSLLRLSQVMAAEVGMQSTNFSECLNKQDDDDREINQFVTNIYLEANNSSSYIQDGFQLLLPVLQQAAIETSQEPES